MGSNPGKSHWWMTGRASGPKMLTAPAKLKEDMRKKGLCREDAWDRSRWRRMLWEGHR